MCIQRSAHVLSAEVDEFSQWSQLCNSSQIRSAPGSEDLHVSRPITIWIRIVQLFQLYINGITQYCFCRILTHTHTHTHIFSFRGGASGKETASQCKRHKRRGFDLWAGKGGGHGNTLQYSCLENPMDRGAWWAMVHRVTKSWTWLKHLSTHMQKRIQAPKPRIYKLCMAKGTVWTWLN